jgi:hypothetical protein
MSTLLGVQLRTTQLKQSDSSEPGRRERLLYRIEAAIRRSDERTRSQRAERILWKAKFETASAFWMDLDTSHIFEEARSCFVGGHYIATVVLATAFMEHTLTDLVKPDKKMSLEGLIDLARKKSSLPSKLLNRLDMLREIRNPFSHRQLFDKKKPDREHHTLGKRSVGADRHPQTVLERDAKKALVLMYAYFQHAILREQIRNTDVSDTNL